MKKIRDISHSNLKWNIALLLAFIMVFTTESSLKLQQYVQYQLETPQILFEPIQYNGQEQHPQINKLAFITPWNNQGKTLTIKYAHKFKYISPCWFDLIINKKNSIAFENEQLHDQNFIDQIKKSNPQIKILPRIYLNKPEVFRAIGSNKAKFESLVNLIFRVIALKKYDGIVWDSPYDLFQEGSTPLNGLIVELLNVLKVKIGKQKLLFFNMANPGNHQLQLDAYKKLKIDALLIQNYDSNLEPIQMLELSIKWIKQLNLQTEILMMLPFFSYKNGEGISTKDVSLSLKKKGVGYSSAQKNMCKFISSQDKTNYIVPCYSYFSKAFQLIQNSGYGAGFWQAGNGLQNYYIFL